MKDPMNELEVAFAKAAREPEAHPELFRRQPKSDLSFLLPYPQTPKAQETGASCALL